MCGITGYVGKNNKCLKILIEGLENLEYRGYDSSGVAYLTDKLNIVKEVGRIKNLKDKLNLDDATNIGIGHTRWATHGLPKVCNAHPHNTNKITIVHNGIIENYERLKDKDFKYSSETDTEVACHLLDVLYNKEKDMLKAILEFESLAKGSYAIALLNSDEKDTLYAIKKNSPLIIGVGDNENFIASDIHAILKYTNKYIVLDDYDYAKITKDKVLIYDKNGKLKENIIKEINEDVKDLNKNGFPHFMLKEINEEPKVIRETLNCFLNNGKIDFDKYLKGKKIDNILILGCGSAVHAGLIGKYIIEEYANIPVSVEIASEFRYKKVFVTKNTLVIPISQSGETADTLKALLIAKEYNPYTLGIINVFESSIARCCDDVLYTKAGPEIAVATTKAYLSQSLILILLALYLGLSNKTISKKDYDETIKELLILPLKLENLLNDENYKKIANIIYKKQDIFFIGRLTDYALCMEGSLKLKEISYIHSEAYAAGELKHGTISLIDKDTYTFAIITNLDIASKTISNVKEVKSRYGKIIMVVSDDIEVSCDTYDEKIIIPKTCEMLKPLLAIIPLQIIAYETAKLKGCDIDKPKNLAKSVTVE